MLPCSALCGGHLRILKRQCPAHLSPRIELFMNFAPDRPEDEVPDPYYGQGNGFEVVLDLIEAAAAGLLADIRQKHL